MTTDSILLIKDQLIDLILYRHVLTGTDDSYLSHTYKTSLVILTGKMYKLLLRSIVNHLPPN